MKLSPVFLSALALGVLALPVAAMAASRNSGMSWFGEHVVNAIIHAVIYGLLFKIFHAIGLVPSIILGAVILGLAYLWSRRRSAAGA